jgi:hypothetical protein
VTDEAPATGLLPRYVESLRRVRAAVLRRPHWRELTAAALALVVAALIYGTFGTEKSSRILRAASWGMLVLGSMAGWGCLVERLAFPQRAGDLGLRMVWGMSALVAAGGALCAVSLATRPVLGTLVVAGAVLWVVETIRSARAAHASLRVPSLAWPTGAIVGLVALLALAATYYVGGCSGSVLNVNDDHVAYLVFPKKILATGTLLEPFSLRRLTALGGHSFMQALTLVGSSSPVQVAMFDLGLALFVAIALILGAPEKRTPGVMRILWVMPVMLMVGVPNLRANSASEVSGVAIFLGLYRTASWKGFAERPLAGAVVLGMLAAAVCTLRQSYLIPAAVFMVVFYLPVALSGLLAPGPEGRRKLAAVGIAAGAILVFLVPWAVVSYRSHGTFLFPLLNGNYRVEYAAMDSRSKVEERFKFFWSNICHCSPIRSIPFFLFAGALIPGRKTAGALPALLWATVVGFISVVYSLPLSDELNNARYYFGFTVAAVVAVMLAAFAALPRRRSVPVRAYQLIPVVFVAAAIVAHIQETRDTLYKDYLRLENDISTARVEPSSLVRRDEPYRALQGTIPAGAKMLVMLDEPFLFNFRRNQIDIVDLPGAASPRPGMPLDDDEKLARYLRDKGYRYVAFVRPASSKSLYRRTVWTRNLTSGVLPIWKLSAPFYLNMFNRWDGLAGSRAHLYDDGQMVALDLEARQK